MAASPCIGAAPDGLDERRPEASGRALHHRVRRAGGRRCRSRRCGWRRRRSQSWAGMRLATSPAGPRRTYRGSQPRRFRPLPNCLTDDAGRLDPRSLGGRCLAGSCRIRCCWRRSGCSNWRIARPTCRCPCGRGGRHSVRHLEPGVPPMERSRPRSGAGPRWFQLYWSARNELTASFSSGPSKPATKRSWSRSTPRCSAGAAGSRTGLPAVPARPRHRQLFSDPVFGQLPLSDAAHSRRRRGRV